MCSPCGNLHCANFDLMHYGFGLLLLHLLYKTRWRSMGAGLVTTGLVVTGLSMAPSQLP